MYFFRYVFDTSLSCFLMDLTCLSRLSVADILRSIYHQQLPHGGTSAVKAQSHGRVLYCRVQDLQWSQWRLGFQGPSVLKKKGPNVSWFFMGFCWGMRFPKPRYFWGLDFINHDYQDRVMKQPGCKAQFWGCWHWLGFHHFDLQDQLRGWQASWKKIFTFFLIRDIYSSWLMVVFFPCSW